MTKVRVLLQSGVIFFLALMSCADDAENASALVIKNIIPDRGMPGSTVTVFGTGLSNENAETEVTFNGVPAVSRAIDAYTVEATVPAGATTGPVSITVGDATVTSDAVFTVVVPIVDDLDFYFGADLSYVNHILDRGGRYKVADVVTDPYEIFSKHGTDLVRLRLWHNPQWTKEVYGADGTQHYNDLKDVARAIASSRSRGMKILLDFHYSDVWADPQSQEIPAAWLDVKSIDVLRDSVYNYTAETLRYLDAKGLMPEFVQIGNETNCGMLYAYNGEPVDGFPACNVCDGQWSNFATVVNGAIAAIRDVSGTSTVQTKIILHVADPENVPWWFDNLSGGGVVSDFDIIGFSYYPIWHTGVPLSELSDKVAAFREKYRKEIMVLEIAYPWTNAGNDSYGNIFGSQTPLPGFPYTPQGQLDIMKAITQELVDGGARGIVYWEPAWITSDMRDMWNTGSAWENNAFFDFEGNVLPVIEFMQHDYEQ